MKIHVVSLYLKVNCSIKRIFRRFGGTYRLLVQDNIVSRLFPKRPARLLDCTVDISTDMGLE